MYIDVREREYSNNRQYVMMVDGEEEGGGSRKRERINQGDAEEHTYKHEEGGENDAERGGYSRYLFICVL